MVIILHECESSQKWWCRNRLSMQILQFLLWAQKVLPQWLLRIVWNSLSNQNSWISMRTLEDLLSSKMTLQATKWLRLCCRGIDGCVSMSISQSRIRRLPEWEALGKRLFVIRQHWILPNAMLQIPRLPMQNKIAMSHRCSCPLCYTSIMRGRARNWWGRQVSRALFL